MKIVKTILFLLATLTAAPIHAARPAIENGLSWYDTEGNPVQAHGGSFLQIGDTWYMIGEDRSSPWNPDVNMYSSKNLVDWKFEGKIIENGKHRYVYPDGSVGELGRNRMIERPKLLYCEKTGQYVIWCHWEASNYGASEAAVFCSDNITGPYKLHWAGRPLGIKSRDCNVFTDRDGTAWFISTTNENMDLGLFKLSDDYLSVVGHTSLFAGKRREAPAVIRVGDRYFMLSSACTGWNPNQCKLSWSDSLTSGWSELTDIGDAIAFDTQATSILTVHGSKETTYLYVGDRWMDPGLHESKTIIFPIEFDETGCNFEFIPKFELNLRTGKWKTRKK